MKKQSSPRSQRLSGEQDEDGIFVATCPSLPGCVSQGATRSEAQANIREAIPPGIEEEVIQVAG